MLCSQKLVSYPHFVLSPPAVMKVLSEGPCTMCVVVLQPVWCAMCGIGVLLLVQPVIVQRPSMSQLEPGLAVCAGPGDTLALLGLALAYDFTAYVWVPWDSHINPDATRKNQPPRPVVFNKVPHAHKKKLHLKLVNSHFTALMPTDKALKMQLNHALPDAFCDTAFDIASGMCATHLLCVQQLDHHMAIRTSVLFAQLELM